MKNSEASFNHKGYELYSIETSLCRLHLQCDSREASRSSSPPPGDCPDWSRLKCLSASSDDPSSRRWPCRGPRLTTGSSADSPPADRPAGGISSVSPAWWDRAFPCHWPLSPPAGTCSCNLGCHRWRCRRETTATRRSSCSPSPETAD